MVTRNSSAPRVVIIGAGIVGCSLADELTERGWTDVTVLEQGPLFATGGSSSHAPGLVFRTNTCRTMTQLADYTVRKLGGLSHDGKPAFNPIGGLELATTPQRAADLERKAGLAAAWGIRAELVDRAQCARLWPGLDRDFVLSGLHTPDDGLANALRACAAQGERAIARGATFLARHTVTGIESAAGRVTGVHTDRGDFAADIVVSAAGFWGPKIGELAGITVPLQPMAHQYVKTTRLDELAGQGIEASRPILRHQDADLYFREHYDHIGIGSYAHRPMPVSLDEIADYDDAAVMPSMLEFTAADFDASWADAIRLLPALGDTKVEEGFNGIFSFTPDGAPLLGESPQLRGFWLAEAVWVTHSAGVGRAVAEWLVDGSPSIDLHSADINRFEPVQLAPDYIRARGCQSFVEVYDVVHPLQPVESPRALRTSPFHVRQRELGGYFLEAAGWERPHWYEANAPLVDTFDVPRRDEWSARFWSPIAAAEARATRDRVALYDMTALKRLEVTGSGAPAFLQWLTTNQLDRKPGAVVYTLMLEESGGIRSDVTVARLGADHFQVGVNGNLDLAWLRSHAPDDGSVRITDITGGTCCIGVWGPLARELVQPLTTTDFSHTGFGFFKAKQAYLAGVPVTAMRLSYVGELGWELYTGADTGLRLWDALFEEGQRHGVIAAGRSAFNSLRLEKGYRSWGTDMTAEHDPYEAGVGFAVRMNKGDFLGRAAIEGRSAETVSRRLVPLLLDEREHIVLGNEPVFHGDRVVGYVTSAAYGYTIDSAIAYAWLPVELTEPGTAVAISYFGNAFGARVAAEPLFDPDMSRIRR
jgi:glycine cleavage system aminomethyltransferase T/glycine/D-amino acid oxidase-like deaminating enzyme